jgi:NAD-dependent glycerol-3-phosphate dehydrogenase C-terminus
MSEGLGLGTNAMAGLVTRGCVEMKRIAQVLGGRPSTLSGLSGIHTALCIMLLFIHNSMFFAFAIFSLQLDSSL